MQFKRLLIAFIIIPLVFLYIFKLPPAYFLFFVIAISCLAQYEFYSMFKVKNALKYPGIFLGVLTIAASYFSRGFLAELFVIVFIIIAAVRLFLIRDPASSLRDVAVLIVGIIYIPGLLIYKIYLREYGAEWIIFLYGCVWASDSMAYYIGKGIGKRKLYAEMSPNKTIAGAVGSVAGGALGAIILKTVFVHSLDLALVNAVVLGIIIGAVSIAGDLVESMFKRDAGVKDSSNMLPEHGGMLDKLDSVLFATPALYWSAKGLGLI